jgi:lipoprotein-anchoring transpeptidase ErfK/SrfK
MYKPYYFRGGYAIHGSPSVPGYPASHGCVRVTNADMDFLRDHLDLGMTVYVYGQRTENPPGVTYGPPLQSVAA